MKRTGGSENRKRGVLALALTAGFALMLSVASSAFGAPFEKDATVAFLGDSITHQGRWTGFVTRYYMERMPERNVRFYNAGVGGDTMSGCLSRLHEDVTPHRPSVIVTMFGMNDVGWSLRAEKYGEKENEQKRQILARYEKNLRALAARLRADNPGVRLVWCTPSIYDETAKIAKANLPGRNRELLAGCAEIVKRYGAETGDEVIDFNGPMAAFNAEKQKSDPTFTLVGPDRVHPLAPGAFFMACEFLRQQGLDPQADKADPLKPWPQTAKSRKISECLACEGVLRGLYAERWFLRGQKVDPDDLKAVAAFDVELKNKGRKGYFEGLVGDYLAKWPQRDEIVRKFHRLRDEAAAMK